MRVFVHDVSPGFANPARRLVHIIYYTAPLRPDYRRTLAPAAPRRLPRHRQPRLDIDHGAPRTATSTTATPPYALGYLDFGTKGYRLLGNLIGYHSSHNFRDASTATTVVEMSVGSVFGLFSSLTVCVATL